MLPVDAFEVELELPAVAEHTHLLSHLGRAVVEQLDAGVVPIRLAVTGASKSSYRCELGVVAGLPEDRRAQTPSVFDFRPRRRENESSFTTVFVVPTGIGSSIGGHAGDATPAAQLLASVSDTLVTHPNGCQRVRSERAAGERALRRGQRARARPDGHCRSRGRPFKPRPRRRGRAS